MSQKHGLGPEGWLEQRDGWTREGWLDQRGMAGIEGLLEQRDGWIKEMTVMCGCLEEDTVEYI